MIPESSWLSDLVRNDIRKGAEEVLQRSGVVWSWPTVIGITMIALVLLGGVVAAAISLSKGASKSKFI